MRTHETKVNYRVAEAEIESPPGAQATIGKEAKIATTNDGRAERAHPDQGAHR